MKVGIIGCGFVGGAILNGLDVKGIKDVVVYDPYNKEGTKNGYLIHDDILSMEDRDVAFVCVPTPMGENGDIITDALLDVMAKLIKMKFGGVVAIKSTVRPDIIHKICEKCELRIVMNPEFLTERTAKEDFLNTGWVIIGGKEEDTGVLVELYRGLFPTANIRCTSLETAAMAKYVLNVFYAVKVGVMNEFFALWKKLNFGSWDELVSIVQLDNRLSPHHMMVPGPSGEYGYFGHCFPKDLNALLSLMKELDTPHGTISGSWDSNLRIRE